MNLDDIKKQLKGKPIHIFLNDNISATERGLTMGHFMKWGDGAKRLEGAVLDMHYAYLVLNSKVDESNKCEGCSSKDACPLGMFEKFADVNSFYVLYTKIVYHLFDLDLNPFGFIDHFVSQLFKNETDPKTIADFYKMVITDLGRYRIEHEATEQLKEVLRGIDPKDLLTKNIGCN